ncbi:MAG: thioesterase family protein [Neptuniibacter sp.]
MQIDEVLNKVVAGELPLISPGWGQGRTTFGGLTAAILCQKMQNEVELDRNLRSFEINFVRPFEALKPYSVEVQTLANGRTATIKRAYLTQDKKLKATATAHFLLQIDSKVTISHFIAPDMKSVDDSIVLQGDDLPELFQHFDVRAATDALPFSAKQVPELGGWVRFKEAPSKITDAHLVCMIDAWPPTASTHYDGFLPLSTISWTIHFTLPSNSLDPKAHIGYHSRINFAEHGLSSSTAEVWDQHGNLLANSTQTNIIYG